MNEERPVCFGQDDCSTYMLSRCPWSKECGDTSPPVSEEIKTHVLRRPLGSRSSLTSEPSTEKSEPLQPGDDLPPFSILPQPKDCQ